MHARAYAQLFLVSICIKNLKIDSGKVFCLLCRSLFKMAYDRAMKIPHCVLSMLVYQTVKDYFITFR